MKRTVFLIAIVLIVTLILSIMASDKSVIHLRGYWVKTYTGDYVRGGASDIVKSKEGIFLIGSIISQGSKYGIVARLSENGEVSNSVAYSVSNWNCEFSSGTAMGKGLAVAGILSNETSGTIESTKLLIARINGNMEPIWAEAFNLSVFPWIAEIESTGDGIIVAGTIMGNESGTFIMKLNQKGEVLWAKLYEARELLDLKDITPDGEGGFLLTGTKIDYGSEEMVIIDIDSRGDVKWAKAYNGPKGTFGSAVLKEGRRIVAVGGIEGNLNDKNRGDVLVTVINDRGNVSWAKAYGGEGIDFAEKTGLLDGGFVVAGIYGGETKQGIPPMIENYSVWLINLDENGKVKWEKTYWEGYPNFLLPEDKSILVGGYLDLKNGSRIFLARIKGDGTVQDSEVTPSFNVRDIELKARKLKLEEEKLNVRPYPVELKTIGIRLKAEPLAIKRLK